MTTHSPRAEAVYTGRATNWPALVAMCVLLVPLLALGMTGDGSWRDPGLLVPLAVVLAAAALAVLTTTSVRATAGPRGVIVHFGVFGWPRFRYPLERIAGAEVVEVPASQWTWGLHWSPLRGTMLTLCGGEALRLTLTGGRGVTISTPDPQAAVAAVERALRAQGGG